MRVIDADALTDELAVIAYTHDCLGILEAINNAPTIDAEPVVRCKDCKIQQVCTFAQWQGDYGYCSYGERSEVEP